MAAYPDLYAGWRRRIRPFLDVSVQRVGIAVSLGAAVIAVGRTHIPGAAVRASAVAVFAHGRSGATSPNRRARRLDIR